MKIVVGIMLKDQYIEKVFTRDEQYACLLYLLKNQEVIFRLLSQRFKNYFFKYFGEELNLKSEVDDKNKYISRIIDNFFIDRCYSKFRGTTDSILHELKTDDHKIASNKIKSNGSSYDIYKKFFKSHVIYCLLYYLFYDIFRSIRVTLHCTTFEPFFINYRKMKYAIDLFLFDYIKLKSFFPQILSDSVNLLLKDMYTLGDNIWGANLKLIYQVHKPFTKLYRNVSNSETFENKNDESSFNIDCRLTELTEQALLVLHFLLEVKDQVYSNDIHYTPQLSALMLKILDCSKFNYSIEKNALKIFKV